MGSRTMGTGKTLGMAAFCLLVAGCIPARASSDAAWTQFRKDVATACLAAVGDELNQLDVAVDPFGSASFGLAIVHGQERTGGEPVDVVCVYDKRAKTVEIGTPFSKADQERINR